MAEDLDDLVVFVDGEEAVGSVERSEQSSGVIYTTALDYSSPQFGSENRDSVEYWGSTRDISATALSDLLGRHTANIPGAGTQGDWNLLERKCGTYSVAYIMMYESGMKVVVRIPAAGWSYRWNKIDAETLKSTAQIMKLIGERTEVPLPQVMAYDISMINEISAPFTIISHMQGQNASITWNSNKSPIPKELRRQNLLRSLANAVSGLAPLKFSKGGSLWFAGHRDDIPVVVDRWTLRADGWIVPRAFKRVKAYSSTGAKLKEDMRKQQIKEGQPGSHHGRGVAVLFKLMVKAFVQATEQPQLSPAFALVHSDLDIQNLLTDEFGTLTGIIDWDGACCEPRQVGWTRLPLFLHGDWYPHFQYPPTCGVHKAKQGADELDRYRRDYARYLWEASHGAFDTSFTMKSHIYRALLSSTTKGLAASRFVKGVLEDISPEAVQAEWIARVGEHGFSEGERQTFEDALLQYFAPVSPKDFVDAGSDR